MRSKAADGSWDVLDVSARRAGDEGLWRDRTHRDSYQKGVLHRYGWVPELGSRPG